jgi:hypothetical protein
MEIRYVADRKTAVQTVESDRGCAVYLTIEIALDTPPLHPTLADMISWLFGVCNHMDELVDTVQIRILITLMEHLTYPRYTTEVGQLSSATGHWTVVVENTTNRLCFDGSWFSIDILVGHDGGLATIFTTNID